MAFWHSGAVFGHFGHIWFLTTLFIFLIIKKKKCLAGWVHVLHLYCLQLDFLSLVIKSNQGLDRDCEGHFPDSEWNQTVRHEIHSKLKMSPPKDEHISEISYCVL